MGVLGGGNGARPPAQPASDEGVDYQDMAGELSDAFAGRDATALAALTPDERAAQLRARQALYDYVDQIWENAKTGGLDPATRPEWNVIAALRDLTNMLVQHAVLARSTAGDEDAL